MLCQLAMDQRIFGWIVLYHVYRDTPTLSHISSQKLTF